MSQNIEFGPTLSRSKYRHVAIKDGRQEIGTLIKDRAQPGRGGYVWFAQPRPGFEALFGNVAEVQCVSSLEDSKKQIEELLASNRAVSQ